MCAYAVRSLNLCGPGTRLGYSFRTADPKNAVKTLSCSEYMLQELFPQEPHGDLFASERLIHAGYCMTEYTMEAYQPLFF